MESTLTTARSYKTTVFFGVSPGIELSVIAKDASRMSQSN
jgi:hypothetical protein